jgi:hypothetical protein
VQETGLSLSTQYLEEYTANGFMEIGLYLSGFGIFDKSKRDLVKLKDSEVYYRKIDKIPLSTSQEL